MTIIMWPFWIFNVAVLVCGRFGRHSTYAQQYTAHLFVSFEIAFVAGGVIAATASVVLLPAVNRQMALEQRLAAEVATAVSALVAGAVEDEDVVSQRRLALERDRAALELLVRLVVHRRDVPLQVVLAVGEVAALRAAEEPLRRRRGRKADRGSRTGDGRQSSVRAGRWRSRRPEAGPSLAGGRSGYGGGNLALHDGRQQAGTVARQPRRELRRRRTAWRQRQRQRRR